MTVRVGVSFTQYPSGFPPIQFFASNFQPKKRNKTDAREFGDFDQRFNLLRGVPAALRCCCSQKALPLFADIPVVILCLHSLQIQRCCDQQLLVLVLSLHAPRTQFLLLSTEPQLLLHDCPLMAPNVEIRVHVHTTRTKEF